MEVSSMTEKKKRGRPPGTANVEKASKVITRARKTHLLQVAIDQLAAEPQKGLSIIAICKKANVPKDTFARWYNDDEEFKHEWDNLSPKLVKKHLYGVVQATIANALSGNAASQRIICEMAGLLGQRGKISQTFKDEGVTRKIDWSVYSTDDLETMKRLMAKQPALVQEEEKAPDIPRIPAKLAKKKPKEEPEEVFDADFEEVPEDES